MYQYKKVPFEKDGLIYSWENDIPRVRFSDEVCPRCNHDLTSTTKPTKSKTGEHITSCNNRVCHRCGYSVPMFNNEGISDELIKAKEDEHVEYMDGSNSGVSIGVSVSFFCVFFIALLLCCYRFRNDNPVSGEGLKTFVVVCCCPWMYIGYVILNSMSIMKCE